MVCQLFGLSTLFFVVFANLFFSALLSCYWAGVIIVITALFSQVAEGSIAIDRQLLTAATTRNAGYCALIPKVGHKLLYGPVRG